MIFRCVVMATQVSTMVTMSIAASVLCRMLLRSFVGFSIATTSDSKLHDNRTLKFLHC